MLDFRLQTFLTVCDTLHYTEAARRLAITQSAVSQHMKYLEDQYGTALVSFTGKKMSLTKSGEDLRDFLQSLDHDIRCFERDFGKGSQREVIKFGASLTIGEYIMPTALARLLEDEGAVDLHMAVNNTSKLLEQLSLGQIDFAIIEGVFDQTAYDGLLFKEERFIPICGPDYEFARPIKHLTDLSGERLFLREEGSGTRAILKEALWTSNYNLDHWPDYAVLGNLNAIKAMVKANLGIAFMYEAVVKEELEAGLVREIPVPEFQLSHDFTCVWPKDSYYKERYAAICRRFREAIED